MSRTNPSGPGTIAWIAAFLVAACAAALSFSALADLARIAGVADTLAPLLPITIDAGVLVAARFWLTPGMANNVTRFARTITLALITASSLGNIAGHAYAETPPERLWLTAAVSLVAPLTLAGLAHLMVIARLDLLARSETEAVPEPVHQPEPDTVPIPIQTPPVLAAVAPEPTAETPSPDDDADPLVDQLRAWVADLGEMPSKRKVIAELGVGDKRATRLMAAAGGAA